MCDNSEEKVILDDIDVKDIPKDLLENENNPAEEDPVEAEKKITESSKDSPDLFKESYMEMDEKFIEYLSVFTKAIENSEKLKASLKKSFFVVIVIIMCGIIITLCSISLISLFIDKNDSTFIVVIGGMLIEGMTAILILPRIIAEYLFNKEEEKHRMEIIKSMQTYNDHKKMQNG